MRNSTKTAKLIFPQNAKRIFFETAFYVSYHIPRQTLIILFGHYSFDLKIIKKNLSL